VAQAVDSLRLSRRCATTPWLPFPATSTPISRDEVVEYLARYAEHFNLPVELNSEVLAVRGGDDRGFVVELRDVRTPLTK
jgi:putative flavoprotein involved in K+ transport